MKLSLFVLGFLTGTLATYLILTQLWWPDVRLAGARPTAQVASANPSPPPLPLPSAFATPEMSPPVVPSDVILESPPLPAAEATPSPAPEILILPEVPAPAKAVELPLLQTDVDRLRMRALTEPVQGTAAKSLRDTFVQARGGRQHQAIDIMAPRGTPVLAVDDGRVEKLFTSKPGGLTIYQFDAQGEYCYYYAHLDGYASGIERGKILRKGDVIGYVGSTGNAATTAPHLHFTIFRLGAEKRWWEGTPINPFPIWTPANSH